jgi:hypothetical protein
MRRTKIKIILLYLHSMQPQSLNFQAQQLQVDYITLNLKNGKDKIKGVFILFIF